MDLSEPSLESPVEQKILWARDILDRRERDLLDDEQVSRPISLLRQAIRRSRQAMSEAGISDLCRTCEIEEGGSCCGAGIEKHFRPTLLLLNLLMGAPIPQTRHDPLSCFFLSDKGCGLLARHVLCVNFLCNKITSLVSPEKIAALREMEGIELHLVFVLLERIKTKLAGPWP